MSDTDYDDKEVQDLIYKLAEDIMLVIAGQDMKVAQSALTLAVVAMLVVSNENETIRQRMLAGLVEAVRHHLARPDIVEWIEQSVVLKGKLQ
jgi:hypothetical protein